MTTQNTLTIAGTTTTAVTTNVTEFVSFVMAKSNGITVPYINAQLSSIGVKFAKSALKEEKAVLWFNALATSDVSVTDESSVAVVTTQPEEEVKMTNTQREEMVAQELKAARNAQNMKALLASPISKKENIDFMMKSPAIDKDVPLEQMLLQVNAARQNFLNNVEGNNVILERVSFYASSYKTATPQQRQNREIVRKAKLKSGKGTISFLGTVIVRFPKGYAQIKQWDANAVRPNGKLGMVTYVPFENVDLNLTNSAFSMFDKLAPGSGLVKLTIVEITLNDGTVFPMSVKLPEDSYKGFKSEIFRTSDSRYSKSNNAAYLDEPLYLSANNANFDAQVTALVRVCNQTFVQALAENRYGYNDAFCQNMNTLGTKDGVTDDMHTASKKSRKVIEQGDMMELSQVGAAKPLSSCSITGEWLDMEAAQILNDAGRYEMAEYTDRDGNMRTQRPDEVMMSGQPVKRDEVRELIIAETCSTCPFYCGNTPKTEAKLVAEVVAKKEAGDKSYVSPFYRETPRPERQAVQTLVRMNDTDKWTLGFPGEFFGQEGVQDIKGLRIKGGGMSLTASNHVITNVIDADYVADVEEFDSRRSDSMKQIRYIFFAAFNFKKLTAEQIEIMTQLVSDKPDTLTAREAKTWDTAVFWFNNAIKTVEEATEKAEQPLFDNCFFPGVVSTIKYTYNSTNPKFKGKVPFFRVPSTLVELHVQDVMGDAMYRAEEGTLNYGLGYADSSAKEFVRFLDETALDYVWDVIQNGTQFSIVGGTDIDKKLAAGALQEMLQKELTGNFYSFANGDYREASLATGIRREENPMEALLELKVSEDVKFYIATLLHLSN